MQHRRTKANIHALSAVRTHGVSIQAAMTHAPDRAVPAISAIRPEREA
jgi:hypothetical protein